MNVNFDVVPTFGQGKSNLLPYWLQESGKTLSVHNVLLIHSFDAIMTTRFDCSKWNTANIGSASWL